MSREKQMEDQSEVLYGGRREGGKRFAEMCAKAFENAEAHHENYDDIFAGYENNLEKAVALIEWQKQEIEGLTIRMNAFGLAIKRLAEERSEHFLLKENGEVVPLTKQSEGEWEIKSEIHQMLDDVDEELYVECPFCKRRFWVPCEFDDKKIFEYAREHYPYCNCGAKMKGGGE